MHDIYTPKSINPQQELLDAADIFLAFRARIEIRIKSSKGVKTACFDSSSHLASAVLHIIYEPDVEAIWVMLNPPPDERFEQAPNKFCALRHTTDDNDI